MSFAALCAMAVPTALRADTPPMRIVSLNLCTDQLLLALAPERIAALSTLYRPLPEPMATRTVLGGRSVEPDCAGCRSEQGSSR